MQKNPASQSGLFNPRILLAFALCSVGVLLAMLSFAATPPSGMTSSDANSPGNSLFADKYAGPLSGNANAATVSMPLAPAAAASWSIVTSPNTSSTQRNSLSGVTCTSASDCWAVGYYDAGSASAFQTLIERWNGTSWIIVASPNSSATQDNFLSAVTCMSASDCWAVGLQTNSNGVWQTLIERWNGTLWTIVTSPNADVTTDNALYSVTCTSASDCWAVGFANVSNILGSAIQTLIERWNGTSWAIVTSLDPSATATNFLFGVTCVSASDCWAVGDYSETLTAQQTLIERWDGTAWAIVASPNTSATQDNELFTVTCALASDCWAVGTYKNGSVYQTLVERWDGTLWGIVTSPNASTKNNVLGTVTCVSASDCWAVGDTYGSGVVDRTLIERWDGTSWAIVTSPNTSATQHNDLSGVTCVSASDCWAVGTFFNGGVFQTLTEHYTVPPVQLVSAASRKVHGSAGTFDVDLPLTGNRGIECRSGGVNGDYTMIFSFVNTLTSVGGASITSGTGTVNSGAIDSNDAHQYIVNLTGVTNAQVITVGLSNVNDSAGNFSSILSASMGVLVGDTTANGSVNSSDISQTKAQSGTVANSSNFRTDVTVNGLINSSDISTVKSKSGTALP